MSHPTHIDYWQMVVNCRYSIRYWQGRSLRYVSGTFMQIAADERGNKRIEMYDLRSKATVIINLPCKLFITREYT